MKKNIKKNKTTSDINDAISEDVAANVNQQDIPGASAVILSVLRRDGSATLFQSAGLRCSSARKRHAGFDVFFTNFMQYKSNLYSDRESHDVGSS